MLPVCRHMPSLRAGQSLQPPRGTRPPVAVRTHRDANLALLGQAQRPWEVTAVIEEEEELQADLSVRSLLAIAASSQRAHASL